MSLKIRKILSVVLLISFLGTCPGISDGFRIWAQQTASQQTSNASESAELPSSDDPFAVNTDVAQEQASAQVASATPQEKPADPVKKEMGRAEKLAWTIGKALLPTLAVMAFGAAVVCPLAWVVVGSVIIGAAVAGITTFAYETRMNQFREEGKKKSRDKILRDVSIAAAVEGAMAPFSLLTAGFVKAIGPTTVKTVVTAAAKAGAAQFVGGTIANITGGTVTNLWYDHYYNYDDEEKELKAELAELNGKDELSEDEKIRAVEIMQRLDALEKEKYTMRNFINDERKTAVTAAISGVLGGAATQIAGNQAWAKIASDKLFKSPKNSGMIARAVVSNPFAFMSGSANAALQKREIDTEISRCRRLQSEYPAGSPGYIYYEDKIAGLEEAKAKIDLIQSGKDSMINNMAVQSAGLTVAVARARLWDLPHARREAIDKKVKENSPEWQKAESIKAKADALRSSPPKRENYSSRSDYRKALAEHNKSIENLDNQYRAAKVIAVDSEKTLEGKALRQQVTQEVDENIELQRRMDLAKSLGDDEYLKFKMNEIKKRSQMNGENLDDEEIRRQAVEEFRSEYQRSAEKSAEKLADMEEKLTLRKDSQELKGKIVTDEEGKKFVVLEDTEGNERFRRAIDEPKDTWYNRFFQKDPALREQREIEAAQRLANAQGAMVKPSSYRAAYVDMKVSELKAQGYTDEQINDNMSSIINEADTAMVSTFGGSWTSTAQAEMLAAGLSRAKYNNGEPPDLQSIYNVAHSTAQSKIISEFKKELNDQAKAYTLTPIKEKLSDGKDDTFREKYVSKVLDKTFDETVGKTTDAKVKELYETVEGTITSTVKDLATEATYDYEKNATDSQ